MCWAGRERVGPAKTSRGLNSWQWAKDSVYYLLGLWSRCDFCLQEGGSGAILMVCLGKVGGGAGGIWVCVRAGVLWWRSPTQQWAKDSVYYLLGLCAASCCVAAG
jgi:hypothetical protein